MTRKQEIDNRGQINLYFSQTTEIAGYVFRLSVALLVS